jgi:hypothetical protein
MEKALRRKTCTCGRECRLDTSWRLLWWLVGNVATFPLPSQRQQPEHSVSRSEALRVKTRHRPPGSLPQAQVIRRRRQAHLQRYTWKLVLALFQICKMKKTNELAFHHSSDFFPPISCANKRRVVRFDQFGARPKSVGYSAACVFSSTKYAEDPVPLVCLVPRNTRRNQKAKQHSRQREGFL